MSLPLLISTLVTIAVLSATTTGVRSESPVFYAVTNTGTNSTAGGARFQTEIGAKVAKEMMYAATRYAWIVFNQTDDPRERKNVSKISLFVEDLGDNATAARTVNASIHLNANFIGNYTRNLRRQFNGVIYQEVAGIWQWDARGQAPVGLVTGIAHYVRLQARYGTVEKVKPGEGDTWDRGNGVTARFLVYCNQLKRGFVGELNKKMRYGYTDGYFLELLGMPLQHLWSNYTDKYRT